VTDLVIPDRGKEVVPRGWAEREVLPKLAAMENVELVDSGRAQLRGAIAAWKAKGHETSELQAAERYCEIRLGELAGPPPGRGAGGPGRESAITDSESFDKDRLYEFRQLAWPAA
jgi:hypothetical protein